jgi:hypothetical protein
LLHPARYSNKIRLQHSAQILNQQATNSAAHAPDSIHEAPGNAIAVTSPINELWSQAYDELRVKDESLVSDYESRLSEYLKTVAALTATGSGVQARD